ncbi:XRE family transcriptional regulator [Clostridium chromiireducens]|uniref:XRE family transcriptional regulator n=1 Tax=Clostridium chromiireducens TaxID=225345 RepID=A0A964W1V3_9CLOT|nr:XRE family transcriptional regulator [Clostridium chromiireducens]MVX63861.1 XRE family transcriptional regulator [Clostridium chromiireducens]
MDKTEKLKNTILSKYSSIREFSKIAEIPSTTLTSALDKGIGGMAVDRIIKICEILNIDIKTFEPINDSLNKSLSKKETILLENYNKLNNLGKEKLIEYSNDLTEAPKYINANENIKELITATKEEPRTLQNLNPTLLAAHDDDLTQDEKIEMDIRILEALKKRK